MHHQLLMQNPRLFEDFRLKESSPERRKEITVVNSAYDSVLCAEFTYVSTPITSGAILYKALDDAKSSDVDELRRDKSFFYNNVIKPNIDAAESVAHAMLANGGAVIAPAIFEAKSLAWSQDDYMGLWLDTIERKATKIAMVDGWEYSNGGCEEYLQALLMQAGRRDRNNISIVDARGDIVSHDKAIALMISAIDNLMERGFSPTVLIKVLSNTLTLHGMVADERDYGQCSDKCGKTNLDVGSAYNDAMVDYRLIQDQNRSLRTKWRQMEKIVPNVGRRIGSSLDLYPGLIRQSERDSLVTCTPNLLQSKTEGDV